MDILPYVDSNLFFAPFLPLQKAKKGSLTDFMSFLFCSFSYLVIFWFIFLSFFYKEEKQLLIFVCTFKFYVSNKQNPTYLKFYRESVSYN